MHRRNDRSRRRKLRAFNLLARTKFPGDYIEGRVDFIARMIINDIVSEGKLFRDAYHENCSIFNLSPEDRVALQHSLIRHGWTSEYNDVGANSGENFNLINNYRIAPAEQYDY